MTTRFFGKPIKRFEDPALLTGKGRFTDDVHLPDTLHAAFVRSPYAHARIVSIDTTAARQMPGVHMVLSASDLPQPLRTQRIPLDVPSPFIFHPITQQALAVNEVSFCGEAVAVIVADSRHLAEDAIEAVIVDYEPLPAVSDCRDALGPNAPDAHMEIKGNMAAKFSLGYGNTEAAFRDAAHVVKRQFHQHRGTGCPLECRAVLASQDKLSGMLTVWSATQAPHGIKRALVEYFGLADMQVRVIAPDVGGGFGPKLLTYPEEMIIPFCAMTLGRPTSVLSPSNRQ